MVVSTCAHPLGSSHCKVSWRSQSRSQPKTPNLASQGFAPGMIQAHGLHAGAIACVYMWTTQLQLLSMSIQIRDKYLVQPSSEMLEHVS